MNYLIENERRMEETGMVNYPNKKGLLKNSPVW